MESRNFAIGVLSTTAAILLVGIVVVITRPSPVLGSGMTVSGGDYIMSVGVGVQLDEEFVYVIDVPAMKMLAYRFDGNRGTIDMLQGADLSAIRQQPPGQPAQPPPPRGGRP